MKFLTFLDEFGDYMDSMRIPAPEFSDERLKLKCCEFVVLYKLFSLVFLFQRIRSEKVCFSV